MAHSSSSGSDDQNMQQQLMMMDERKRKRMQSNRESAKRSRVRKQQHFDDLTAQVARLTIENNQILTKINVTKQHLIMTVEAENSVLRAQMMELTQRLKSLNEILDYMNSAAGGGGSSCMFEAEEFQHQGFGDGFFNSPCLIMTSADVFDY